MQPSGIGIESGLGRRRNGKRRRSVLARSAYSARVYPTDPIPTDVVFFSRDDFVINFFARSSFHDPSAPLTLQRATFIGCTTRRDFLSPLRYFIRTTCSFSERLLPISFLPDRSFDRKDRVPESVDNRVLRRAGIAAVSSYDFEVTPCECRAQSQLRLVRTRALSPRACNDKKIAAKSGGSRSCALSGKNNRAYFPWNVIFCFVLFIYLF